MCLDKLKDFKVKLDEKGVGEGWKVFNKGRYGGLYTELRGNDKLLRKNKWLKEETYRFGRGTFCDGGYPYGFHVFLAISGAKNWGGEVIKKVMFRKIVAKGIQQDYRVIVAKEIFIPDDK